MPTPRKIRKNILTGNWEHYVELPQSDTHWLPGLYDYQGEFPIPIETHSLVRNGEGYLISYQDILFTDYEVASERLLPDRIDVYTEYDIKFTEFFPSTPLEVKFEISEPTTETVTLEAKVIGGFPYRSPDEHYYVKWEPAFLDGRHVKDLTNVKDLKLTEMGTGRYTLTIVDANKGLIISTVYVKDSHLIPLETLPDKTFRVALKFVATNLKSKTGTITAYILKGDSIPPHKIIWKEGNITRKRNSLTYEGAKLGETYEVIVRDSSDELPPIDGVPRQARETRNEITILESYFPDKLEEPISEPTVPTEPSTPPINTGGGGEEGGSNKQELVSE